MPNFSWGIDAENYLPNGDAYGCKMKTKDFIKRIAAQLNDYCLEDWHDIRNKPHNHTCNNLKQKPSKAAKRLDRHLQEINRIAGETESTQLEPFQIKIGSFPNKKEFRIFGYIKSHRFYLVHLDPKHDVYK